MSECNCQCQKSKPAAKKRSREDNERIIEACRELIAKLQEDAKSLPHGI